MHWATRYIGQAWVHEAHDCWGFFRKVQGEQFGRQISPFGGYDSLSRLACARAVQANPERQKWQAVDVPAEGDAVLLAHSRHPSHVGIWVAADGGGVLHCIEGAGVVFQSVKSLRMSGWGHLEFYRHV